MMVVIIADTFRIGMYYRKLRAETAQSRGEAAKWSNCKVIPLSNVLQQTRGLGNVEIYRISDGDTLSSTIELRNAAMALRVLGGRPNIKIIYDDCDRWL